MTTPDKAPTTPAAITRRTFVEQAATLGVAATIVPRAVLGGPRHVPPSRRLNVAMIGGGGMGASNAAALVKGGERIVAVADVDQAFVDKTVVDRMVDRETGEPNEEFVRLREEYAKVRRYDDFRRMLERERGIDAVVIATPDHVHAVAAQMAMELGKHVYLQKPLTHSVHESRVLRETAARTRVVTQMGNQGHSSREAGLINEWIRAGAIGPVREVHAWTNRPIWPQGIPRPHAAAPAAGAPRMPFGNPYTSQSLADQLAAAMQASGGAARPTINWDLYLGPAPAVPFHPIYHPFNWRGFVDFGVGALGDMGAHLIDHPYWALGLAYPTSVEATSTPWGGDENDVASYPQAMLVHYDFPARGAQPPVRLTWYDGGLMPQRPAALPDDVELERSGGVIMVGDKGVLLHETYGENPRIYPEALFRQVAPAYVEEVERKRREEELRERQKAAGARPPRQLETSPVVTHEMQWANAIKAGTPASSPFDYASRLTETMLLGIVALRAGQGQKIYYDGAAGRVTNLADANQYLRREYRAGWSL
jgi:predicted dehydrogenase